MLGLVEDGWLSRTRPLYDGRTSNTASYIAGDTIGLDRWAGAEIVDRITTLTPIRIVCLDTGSLLAVLADEGDFARSVLRPGSPTRSGCEKR